MKVIIQGVVLVKDPAPEHVRRLQQELTYTNPEFTKAMRSGKKPTEGGYIITINPKYSNAVQKEKSVEGIPKYVTIYPRITYYTMRGNSIMIPRGSIGYLLNMTKFPKEEILDFTVAPPAEFDFTGKLRDYQALALPDMLGRRYGLIEAATGAGKTIMGIAYAAERKLKTLIIVHSKELLDQWNERLLEFTTLDSVGILGDGKFDVQDVTVGIINTVRDHLGDLNDQFGTVVLDECHRAMGDSWTRTINTLKPKNHIGLSATPYRSDGLTKALYRVIGPMVHKVDRAYLEDSGAVMAPRIIRLNTKFFFNFRKNYAPMITAMTRSQDRNIKIANTIIGEFRKYSEPTMVVSDRVTHCETLKFLLEDQAGIKPILLHGKISKDKRKQAVADMKAGKYNVLVATVQLLGEGFDAPDLNALFLCTPIKFQGRTLQTIGRILRPSKGGKPRVYDFRDPAVKVLRNSGFARDRVYKSHGWVQ